MNEPQLENTIKISVTAFEKHIAHSYNHVWFGILKRNFWDKKNTVKGWFDVIEQLKAKPAN